MSHSTLGARSEHNHSTARVLRIKDYERVFSVSQSKRVKNPSWFPMTNRYDSAGVLDLLEESNGIETLGVWLLMLQLVSTLPHKGQFLNESNKPISLKRIAQRLRIPVKKMELAVENLLSVEWLEYQTLESDVDNQELDNSEHAPSTLRADSEHSMRQKRREEKKEDIIRAKNALDCASFEKFWNLYDKKTDKSRAVKAWNRLSQKDRDECMAKVADYVKATPDPRYRKNPTTYLNGKNWNDELNFVVNGTAKAEPKGATYQTF